MRRREKECGWRGNSNGSEKTKKKERERTHTLTINKGDEERCRVKRPRKKTGEVAFV